MEEESKHQIRKSEHKIILKGKRHKTVKKLNKSQDVDTSTNTSASERSRSSASSMTLNEAIEHTKGSGLSHYIYGIFLAISYGTTGFSMYVIPFMTKFPDYL